VIEILKKEIISYSKSNSLNNVEIPKQIQILEEAFSIENGILTPTMKL
jgi:long-subunit acyl-CoA synthetase (AMP-forming)